MGLLDGEPRGEPRTEDKALAELSRRFAAVEQFATSLHHDLPAGDRREVAAWVRARLLDIINGK